MSKRALSWTVFSLLCLIWGSSFILMKTSQRGLSVGVIAALRIFSAGVVFLPFAIFHVGKIPKNKLFLVIINGVFGNLIPAFLFSIAVSKINSSLAGVLNSLTPICVVMIGLLLFRDKIKSNKIIGVLIGFVGLVLLTLTQKELTLDNFGYAFLVIGATVSYGLNINLVAHYLKDIKPLHVASVSVAAMLIPSGLLLWQQGFLELDFSDQVIQWSMLNTLLLGIVGSSIGTFLFYLLVQTAGGLFASLVTYGVPIVAICWGLVFGEPVTLLEIGCLCVILFGVYLANRK